MFRKLFVFSMIIILVSFQVNAATHNNLKAAFDDLNHALTAEHSWRTSEEWTCAVYCTVNIC